MARIDIVPIFRQNRPQTIRKFDIHTSRLDITVQLDLTSETKSTPLRPPRNVELAYSIYQNQKPPPSIAHSQNSTRMFTLRSRSAPMHFLLQETSQQSYQTPLHLHLPGPLIYHSYTRLQTAKFTGLRTHKAPPIACRPTAKHDSPQPTKRPIILHDTYLP